MVDEIICDNVLSQDVVSVDDLDTTSLSAFPELNERLYLCYLFGRNVSPEKSISLDMDIPIEYEVYVQLMGKLTDEEKSALQLLYPA